MAGGTDFAVDLEATAESLVVEGLVELLVLPRVFGGVQAVVCVLASCVRAVGVAFLARLSIAAAKYSPFLSRRHGMRSPAERVVIPGNRANGEEA